MTMPGYCSNCDRTVPPEKFEEHNEEEHDGKAGYVFTGP